MKKRCNSIFIVDVRRILELGNKILLFNETFPRYVDVPFVSFEVQSVVDLRETRVTPPPGQNFFIFMQFSGKIGQIIGCPSLSGFGHPTLGILEPPLAVNKNSPIVSPS